VGALVGLAQTVAHGIHTSSPTVVRSETLIDASAVDHLILPTYLGFVLGIGLMAWRSVSASMEEASARRALMPSTTSGRHG